MTGHDHIARDEQARAILLGNDRGGYTVPTAGLYPYQWNWDSAFAALGFATFNIERARTEINTLLAGQWSNGMVPHILFHGRDPGYFPGPEIWGRGKGPVPSSGISQPPVAATVVRDIWEADRLGGEAWLRAQFPRLKAWHRWFMEWRTDDHGAVFVTHPWEAGRDNCLDWDEAMAAIDPVGVGDYARRDTSHVDPEMRPTKEDYDRYVWLVQRGHRLGWDDAALARDMPFCVSDPTMTFILLRANRDLAALGIDLGEDISEVETWTSRLEGGATWLKNPELGMFDAVNLNTGVRTGNLSSASFLCWYGGRDDDWMLGALDRAFLVCRYPVPSQDATSRGFDPKRYWRGPTWAVMNALIARGLMDANHVAAARRLRDVTRSLIASHGFAEYFDPMSGAPAGGGTFTWTAAVWLAWASPSAGGE